MIRVLSCAASPVSAMSSTATGSGVSPPTESGVDGFVRARSQRTRVVSQATPNNAVVACHCMLLLSGTVVWVGDAAVPSLALIAIDCDSFLFGCNTTLEAGRNFNADSYHATGIQTDRAMNDGEDGACFAADTLVMMAGGLSKKIIDIKVGDTVKSYHIESGKIFEVHSVRNRENNR